VQAHAHDLRSEVADGWSTLVDARPCPDAAGLDAFTHQVARDWRGAPLSAQTRRLLEFAEKVTATPAACRQDDVRALRAAGFSDAAIHDATQVISYFNYINRVADALGVAPEADLPRWGEPL
jgi:uncharacterized peroxidase-related enzyme